MDKTDAIAKRLRSRRKVMNVSRQEVAEAIGTSTSAVSAWERQGEIGLEEACKAADYYRCTLDELAGRPWPPTIGETRKPKIGAADGNSSGPHR